MRATLIAQKEDSLRVFCANLTPRSIVVPAGDPELVKSGTFENIFTPFSRAALGARFSSNADSSPGTKPVPEGEAMRRRTLLVAICSAVILSATPAHAQGWRWLWKLSGPGDFTGYELDVKLVCGYGGSVNAGCDLPSRHLDALREEEPREAQTRDAGQAGAASR